MAIVVVLVFGLVPLAGRAGAGAIAPGITCIKSTGTLTFTPPLPWSGNEKKALSAVTVTNGKVFGCTGSPGPTSGTWTYTASLGRHENCITLIAGTVTVGAGTLAIAWNNHTSSTVAVIAARTTYIGTSHSNSYRLVGKVTKGEFVGLSHSATYTGDDSGCTNPKWLKTSNLKNAKPVVIN